MRRPGAANSAPASVNTVSYTHLSGVQDGSLVLGNLMNAAHALGLGSCWINRIRETFERPDGQALLKKWGVEGEWTGVGSCILGYPEGPEPSPAERKPGYYRIIR